jgi:hypothetical protein
MEVLNRAMSVSGNNVLKGDFPHGKRLFFHLIKSIWLAFNVVFVLTPMITILTYSAVLDTTSGPTQFAVMGFPVNYIYHFYYSSGSINGNIFVLWALVLDLIFWAALGFIFFLYHHPGGFINLGLLIEPSAIFLAVYTLEVIITLPHPIIRPPWLVFWP